MRKGLFILLGMVMTVSVSAQRFVKSLDTLSQMSLSPIDLHTNAFVPGQGIFTWYGTSVAPTNSYTIFRGSNPMGRWIKQAGTNYPTVVPVYSSDGNTFTASSMRDTGSALSIGSATTIANTLSVSNQARVDSLLVTNTAQANSVNAGTILGTNDVYFFGIGEPGSVVLGEDFRLSAGGIITGNNYITITNNNYYETNFINTEYYTNIYNTNITEVTENYNITTNQFLTITNYSPTTITNNNYTITQTNVTIVTNLNTTIENVAGDSYVTNIITTNLFDITYNNTTNLYSTTVYDLTTTITNHYTIITNIGGNAYISNYYTTNFNITTNLFISTNNISYVTNLTEVTNLTQYVTNINTITNYTTNVITTNLFTTIVTNSAYATNSDMVDGLHSTAFPKDAGDAGYIPVFMADNNTLTNSPLYVSGAKVYSGITSSVEDGSFVVGSTFTGAVGFHGFRDETKVQSSGDVGYASIDLQPTMSTANLFNHYVGVQSRPVYSGSGGISSYFHGMDVFSVHSGAGLVANYRGLNIWDLGGLGAVTSDTGLLINAITRGTDANYGLYIVGTSVLTGNNYSMVVAQGRSVFNGQLMVINGYSDGALQMGRGNSISWASGGALTNWYGIQENSSGDLIIYRAFTGADLTFHDGTVTATTTLAAGTAVKTPILYSPTTLQIATDAYLSDITLGNNWLRVRSDGHIGVQNILYVTNSINTPIINWPGNITLATAANANDIILGDSFLVADNDGTIRVKTTLYATNAVNTPVVNYDGDLTLATVANANNVILGNNFMRVSPFNYVAVQNNLYASNAIVTPVLNSPGDMTIATDANLYKITMGNDWLTLTNGKVGINTNNPQFALDVQGDAYLHGTLGVVGQLTSLVTDGTMPFLISSTSKVDYLNSDLLDGYHASYFAPTNHTQTANTITAGTFGTGTGGNNYVFNVDTTRFTFGGSAGGIVIDTNPSGGANTLSSLDEFNVACTLEVNAATVNMANLTVSGALTKNVSTPTQGVTAGTHGEIRWDDNYIYVCLGGTTWKRASLNSW